MGWIITGAGSAGLLITLVTEAGESIGGGLTTDIFARNS